MHITVVILNWNRPDETVRAVASVLNQDYPDFDILIWDNASTQESKEKLKADLAGHANVQLVFGDDNFGVAGGRNRAFPLARGDLIVSLDSDAVLEKPDSLRIIAGCLQTDPRIGAVSFEVRRLDNHVWWPFSRPLETWRNHSFDTFRIDGCAFATPRKIFAEAGGFPEYFSPYGAEDAYYAMRLIGLGYRVIYLPFVRVVHDASVRGRLGLAFIKHVRNTLWIRLELFPWPNALFSTIRMYFLLLKDALEQHQVGDYLKGVGQALLGFRWSRRRPIPREHWRQLRRLIEEDKRLTQPSGN